MTKEENLSPRELRAKRRRGAKIRSLRMEARKAEVLNNTRVITLADLDGDQLAAHDGICEWWNTMKQCGGLANPLTIGGFAGCYDMDTEFFSQRGWVRFCDYEEGDLVSQYVPETGCVELVQPDEYIKLEASNLTHFASQGVDQCLSDEHRVVYWTNKDHNTEPKVIPFREVKSRHLRSAKGWSGKFKTTFNIKGEDIDISDHELRLQIAVNADGRVVKDDKGNYTQMRFSKERKYKRLLLICKEGNLNYSDRGVNNQGQYEVIVYPKYNSKRYDNWYYSLSQRQMSILVDEVTYWDGTVGKCGTKRFTSIYKEDADLIQYAFAATGHNTSITKNTRDIYTRMGTCFTVNGSTKSGNGFRTIQGRWYKTEMVDYKTKDGFKYCFSVPTKMLLVRRNNKIVISGNTGKSTLISIVIPSLNNGGKEVRVKYCAFMGKAANVLIMKGLPASTIHSLIYDYIEDPRPNLKNQLKHEINSSVKKKLKSTIADLNSRIGNQKPDEVGKLFIPKYSDEIEADLIVVDEASQVPEGMRRDLESLGIPIVYTGDHGQLKPVEGEGNIMEDPMFKLETPHRQALNSGIIQMATLVRTGESVDNGIIGVKKDAYKVPRSFINDVKLLVQADMVICYTNKTRASLNSSIRKYKGYNGIYPEVGERLICVKNNKLTGLFNGLVLYVKSIRIEYGYLMMNCVDEIGKEYWNLMGCPNYFNGMPHPKLYGGETMDLFEFAYAITGHKCLKYDTIVETTSGRKQICDLTVEDRVYTMEGNTKRVIDVVSTGEKIGYKVTTESGHSIICSEDHRLYGSVKDELPRYSVVSDLDKGDFLAVYTKERQYTNSSRYQQISEDTSYILGALIGDGCYSISYKKDHRVDLTSQDTSVLDAYKMEIKRRGLNWGITNKAGCSSVYTHSVVFREWLLDLGFDYVTAHNKSIPDYFLNSASLLQRKALLSGLVDTDGSLCDKKKCMRYVTASKQLSVDIGDLLSSLGVRSSCGKRLNAYTVFVRSNDYRVLCNILKLKVSDKNLKCIKGRDYHPHKEEKDKLPFSGKLLSNIKNSCVAKGVLIKNLNKYLRNCINGTLLNRSRVMNSLSVTGSDDIRLPSYVSGDFRYDKVISIEKVGMVSMFDIEVEDDHNFIANGIISHNSQGSEWEDVVVVEEKQLHTTLEDKRRWLYTALTRASKRLTWISRFG